MKHRIDERVWIAAGEAYLRGAKITDICRRFGMSRSTFYVKADAMGWRQPDEDYVNEAPPEGAVASLDLAERAIGKASAAVERGELQAAQGWTALAAKLRLMAMQEEGVSHWRGALISADDRDQRVFDATTGRAMDEGRLPDLLDRHDDRTPDSLSDTDRTVSENSSY